jgi:hypothetical protein
MNIHIRVNWFFTKIVRIYNRIRTVPWATQQGPVSSKSENICTVKQTIDRTKRKSAEWEKIFVSCTSDKGLVSKIYKAVKQFIKIRWIKRLRNGHGSIIEIFQDNII